MNEKSSSIVEFDPLSDSVLRQYVLPAVREFQLTHPAASTIQITAANAISYEIGACLVMLARLNTGLDDVELKADKTGLLIGDFIFNPTPADTIENRTVAGRLILGDHTTEELAGLAASLPSRREPNTGMYL